MLPTFIVIGAMKAGTESLFRYLQAHPDVFMPPDKELNFFVEEGNWRRGVDWYRQQFAGASAAKAIGEISPNYSKYPILKGVPRRVASLCPSVKLVYLMRDPIERMRSQYLHAIRVGEETLSIDKALMLKPRYLYLSRYALQIERYLEYFPRDRLLLITSESLRSDRLNTVNRIVRFLGLDPFAELGRLSETHNRAVDQPGLRPILTSWKVMSRRGGSPSWPSLAKRITRRLTTLKITPDLVSIDGDLREGLEDLLRDDVAALRAHMDDDFDNWEIA